MRFAHDTSTACSDDYSPGGFSDSIAPSFALPVLSRRNAAEPETVDFPRSLSKAQLLS